MEKTQQSGTIEKIPLLNLMIGKEPNTTNALVGALRNSDNKKEKDVSTTRKNSTFNINTINTIFDPQKSLKGINNKRKRQ